MNHTRFPLALAVFLVLLGVSATVASAAISDGASYTVTLLKYEPTPAQPGDIVEAWIQITNTGGGASPATTLVVDASYPFTPASSQDATIYIGPIAAASSYVTRVKLTVDTAASDGMYSLPVRLTADGNSFQTTDLSIQVRSSSGVLSVTSAKTVPEEIVPGAQARFDVVVSNAQASTLRDVTVSLDLTDTGLATIGTTTKQTFARIEGDADQSFRFQLVANPEAQTGIVSIPITFTFTNAEGTEVTQTETVGVVVHAKPDVSVLVDRVTRSADGNDVVVLARVINKGLSQVKFAELAITPSDSYTMTGRSSVYVGNIDSDDFQTAEYTITPTGDNVNVVGTLTYRDALNQPYSVPVSLAVAVPAKAGGSFSPVVIVVILIIVVIIGIIIWRRRGSKKPQR